jgi:hypothetical protein
LAPKWGASEESPKSTAKVTRTRAGNSQAGGVTLSDFVGDCGQFFIAIVHTVNKMNITCQVEMRNCVVMYPITSAVDVPIARDIHQFKEAEVMA